MLTLYAESNWDSPWVFSAFVALREKGLEFQEIALDLGRGDARDPAYRARTLTGRVPALDHDGFVLSESSAIVEYLEERFPPPAHAPLLPADLQTRARARQILSWLRTDFGPVREERPTTTMFFERTTAPLGEAARASLEKLLAGCERLVPQAGGALFGAWSIADAELSFMLHRLLLNGDAVPSRIERWARAAWQRPSVQAFVRHPRGSTHP